MELIIPWINAVMRDYESVFLFTAVFYTVIRGNDNNNNETKIENFGILIFQPFSQWLVIRRYFNTLRTFEFSLSIRGYVRLFKHGGKIVKSDVTRPTESVFFPNDSRIIRLLITFVEKWRSKIMFRVHADQTWARELILFTKFPRFEVMFTIYFSFVDI